MANCPNCGVKIGKLDWRPNCKECGVNLVYFDIEKRLLADSERAEAEHRDFVRKTARVKSSFIGSPLAIVRIVLSLLPVGALFLPLAKIVSNIPFYAETVDVNAIKVYELLSTFNFGGFFAALGSDIVGTPAVYLLVSVLATLLMAVGIILNLLLITLACSPKGKIRSITVPIINIVLAVVAVIFFNMSGAGFAEIFPGAYSASVSFGAYVAIAALVLSLIINVILCTKKFEIKVVYPEIIPLGYKKPKKEKKSPLDKLFKKNKKTEAKKEEVKEEKTEAEAKK